MWSHKHQRFVIQHLKTKMTIRAKHTLCSLKKAIYAHIWNTMFKNREREKISVLNHNLLSKRTCRRWKLSHVKCNTSEKVANQPNKLVPFWNLCVHPHKSLLPLLPRRNLIRKVFPEGVGKCMKIRSHTDEIWWFAKNWTWWCSVNSQRNDNFEMW